MNNKGEIKKIILVVILLVILSVGIVFVRTTKQLSLTMVKKELTNVVKKEQVVTIIPTPTFYDMPGIYSINLTKPKIKAGEKTDAEIIFMASGVELNGSDVVLKFDKDKLRIDDKVVLGDYFSSYPIQIIDNEKGILKISGFRPKNRIAMSNPTKLCVVTFTAQKPGNSEISFDFEKSKTNRTTLVERGTSLNILGQANPVTLTIE
jgi:hypothetical protein